MSQAQPSSLQHYRALRDRMGCEFALINAAADVDNLTDHLGRKLDLEQVIKGSVFGAGMIAGLAIAWLMACGNTIHQEAPADWPKLETRVHRVGLIELHRRCAKYMTTTQRITSLGIVGGCAEINFATNRCDIWLPEGENDPMYEKHERDHCLGRDHVGDTTLRDAWNNWMAR